MWLVITTLYFVLLTSMYKSDDVLVRQWHSFSISQVVMKATLAVSDGVGERHAMRYTCRMYEVVVT